MIVVSYSTAPLPPSGPRTFCDRRGKLVEQAVSSCVAAYRSANERHTELWLAWNTPYLIPCINCPTGAALTSLQEKGTLPAGTKISHGNMRAIYYVSMYNLKKIVLDN